MPWTKVLIDDRDLKTAMQSEGLRVTTYVNALNEAHRQLLESDPAVYVIGEGIDDPGGVFGSTAGLAQTFGPERIMDMPIAENGLTGIALGSALCGMKPIFVHMRQDFLPMCMDQIVNHAAKWHYMTGGHCNAPIVIRALTGRGWGSAAQHSQALHSVFTAFAGLKVAVPATPYDAKGLLISAVKDGNPVLFCEHRWLYGFEGYAPQEMYTVPFGKAVIRQPGTQVTIVAVSLMVYEAIKAARLLTQLGVSAEVIDPRTIKPLDRETIAESIKKTGRLIVADTGGLYSGISAEIIACACDDAFSSLKTAPVRIGLPDCPTPAGPELEKAFYPDAHAIVNAALKLVKQ